MARALKSPFTVVIRQQDNTNPPVPGSNFSSDVCNCSYQIVDGDLSESGRNVGNASPDLTQTVAQVCAQVAADIKAAEGI